MDFWDYAVLFVLDVIATAVGIFAYIAIGGHSNPVHLRDSQYH